MWQRHHQNGEVREVRLPVCRVSATWPILVCVPEAGAGAKELVCGAGAEAFWRTWTVLSCVTSAVTKQGRIWDRIETENRVLAWYWRSRRGFSGFGQNSPINARYL